MEDPTDSYRTLAIPSKEVLHKERRSKFYGYAFPITTLEDVKPYLVTLQKKHPSANHFCYAWKFGVGKTTYRTNDDGEPNNSAGMPIYGQIIAFELTNVLVVVPRIFGGTKLGVGGLVQAYKTAAHLALEASTIVLRYLTISFEVRFGYENLDTIMRIVKQFELTIGSREMEIACKFKLTARKSVAENVWNVFSNLPKVQVKKILS